MAARTRRINVDDKTRKKIQATQLIKRLTSHALGELEKPMDPSQVRAAEILLKKTIPDLSNVEMTGEGGGPLSVNIVKYNKSTK
jgi:hypothetical protein